MKQRPKRTWLFAFCDLAFLLLISLSLIPTSPADISLRLAEMELPEVPDSSNLKPAKTTGEAWELRVFAVSERHPKPYRLNRRGSEEGIALDQANLIPALRQIGTSERPQLLPEKASLSQDFLFAAAAVARVWSEPGQRALVRPLPPGGDE